MENTKTRQVEQITNRETFESDRMILNLYTLHYTLYHIPTQTRHPRKLHGTSRQDCLEQLDEWNAQSPGVWQFYSNQPYPAEEESA